MRATALTLLAALLLAGGCAPAPELAPADPQLAAAPWPTLLPRAQLPAAADTGPATPEEAAALQARAAALRARAAALRARPFEG